MNDYKSNIPSLGDKDAVDAWINARKANFPLASNPVKKVTAAPKPKTRQPRTPSKKVARDNAVLVHESVFFSNILMDK